MFAIISLTVLFLIIIIVGSLLYKKIKNKEIGARITYIITVLGIAVGILTTLIISIDNYVDNRQKNSPTSITNESFIDNSKQPITDDNEPNNDLSLASSITVNKEITGRFEDNDDIDCYSFSTEEKLSFQLKFTHDFNDSDYVFCSIFIYSETDLENSLYKFESYENNKEVVTSKIRIPSGNYYIKIVPYSYRDLTIKDYNFIITTSVEDSSFESEPNNTISESKTNNSISLNSNVTGNIQTLEDVDYYHFQVTNPGKLDIDFSHNKIDDDSSLWKIELLTENQEETIISFEINGSKTVHKCDTINIAPTKKGESYYLKISPYYNYSANDYTICVNFSEFEEPSSQANGTYNYDKESNNSTDTATPISLNKNIEGNIQSSSDVDYFKFSVNNDGKLNILFNHDFIDSDAESWTVSILSEADSNYLLDFNIANNESSKKSDTIRISPGTYYIKIQPTYNYNNDAYNFKVNYNKV